MSISVAATGSAAVTTNRSPSVTFGSYTPALNDVVVFVCNTGASAAGAVAPSGWGTTSGAVFSDSHTGVLAYHLVTAAEVSAVTTTYTATNLWNAVATGNVVGVVLRGVDPDIQWDDAASGLNSANSATPHVIPALTNTAEIRANSMVIGAFGSCSSHK